MHAYNKGNTYKATTYVCVLICIPHLVSNNIVQTKELENGMHGVAAIRAVV